MTGVRPLALVTGASAGIGEAFARALAARGYDLVITARREERLQNLARTLSGRHGVNVWSFPVDLAERSGPEALVRFVELLAHPLDLLVSNAGFGFYGQAHVLPLDRELACVDVNVRALVELTERILPGMVARRSGAVIHVASVAGFQPVPYMATYGATKAFVLVWSEAVAQEVAPYGVQVMAVCPGYTPTEFQALAGLAPPVGRSALPPDEVVRRALSALDRGKRVTVPGVWNKLQAVGYRFAPRRLVASVAESTMKRRRRSEG